MQNILESAGAYITSGSVLADSWPSTPAEGTELLAITLDNDPGAVRGAMAQAGWAAIPESEILVASGLVTAWKKTAGASEPTAIGYTATGGGHHGIKAWSFPAGTTFVAKAASTDPNATYTLDLGSLSAARSWFAMTGVVINGGTSTKTVTDGFTKGWDQARAAMAVKSASAAGTVAPDWDITGTTARVLTATLVVALEAEAVEPPPEPTTGIKTYLIRPDGTLLPAVWRLVSAAVAATFRNAFDVPFESVGWPNMALSDSATLQSTTGSQRLNGIGGKFNKDNGWSYVLEHATTADPYVDIIDTGDGVGSRKGYVPVDMEIPYGVGPKPTYGGYDRPCIVLQPDGTWITMYGAHKIADASQPGGYRWDCYRVEDVSGTTDGITGGGSIGSRADGLADAWGIVREYDFNQGEIRHMLAMALDESHLIEGHVWPAVSDDYNPYPTGGACRMGEVYAIPKTTAKPSGVTSAFGISVFNTLQNFGAQVRDESAGSTTFYAEQGGSQAFTDAVNYTSNNEMGLMMPLLRQVTNITGTSGSANYPTWRTNRLGKGGGTPYVEFLPPIG